MESPEFLYYGTSTEALKKMMESGEISRMGCHAVHMREKRN
ncbi:MAG: RNA 2'-phosphotransferase [Agathobacter sp.]|nr:RNA 2'-phosphotransferase [Agathobacter sp.]